MMKKFLGASLVFAFTVVLATPFAREIHDRRVVAQHLSGVHDERDRAALDSWTGSARTFIDSLYDRCVRTNGGPVAACDRYRSPID